MFLVQKSYLLQELIFYKINIKAFKPNAINATILQLWK